MDAVNLIKDYMNNVNIDLTNITVDGWDSFSIHITGDKFHNSITPSVMKGFIEMQQALYEAYALTVYNEKNVNRLTSQEKKQLEIKIVVTEGTTNLDIDVNAFLTELIKATAGKMDSEHVFILFLFVIVAYFGSST